MPVSAQTLDRILPFAAKPGRYIGGESNAVVRDPAQARLHFCLVFPEVYEIGMSHTGLHLLYHIINRQAGCYAERAFAPWPDLAARMKENRVPLYSLETYTPLREFDVVGLTLQSELCYTNVPYVLDLAGIPPLARDRTDGDPLVIAGGPDTANPEPVADFFDFLVIGDGEVVLPPLLEALQKCNSISRAEKIRAAAAVPGVYVPSRHPARPDAAGMLIPMSALPERKADRVKRAWARRLDASLYAFPNPVPNLEPVQSRVGVEIMRGCTQGCRFCQAGFWYRPVREMEPGEIVEAIETGSRNTGMLEVGLLALSTADYSKIQDLVGYIKRRRGGDQPLEISLPSLRADAYTEQNLAAVMDGVQANTITFAPESGSERLRRVINKCLTGEQVLEAGRLAFQSGYDNVKLYFMAGLPTETDEDLAAAADLILKMRSAGRHVSGRKNVNVTVGVMVPKPGTPFQWEAMPAPAELERRINFLKEKLYHRDLKISWPDVRRSRLEAVLAAGDRRLAAVILEAWKLGCRFDGWDEEYKPDVWEKAFQNCGLDPEAYLAEKKPEAPLPWDVIDSGVTKEYLLKERKKALAAETTPDCREQCLGCGLAPAGEDRALARESVPGAETAAAGPAPSFGRGARRGAPEPAAYRPAAPQNFIYRLRYQKTGLARFLSHRNLLTLFSQALLRTGRRFRYTEGFRPRLWLTAGPALPLGYESECEWLEATLQQEAPADWGLELNRFLTRGLEVKECRLSLPTDPSLNKFKAQNSFVVDIPEDLARARQTDAALQRWYQGPSLVIKKPETTHSWESHEWVQAIGWDEGLGSRIELDMQYIHNEPSLTLDLFLQAALQFTPEELLRCRCRKLQMRFLR